MRNDYKTAIYNLKTGIPPGNPELIEKISVGIDFITDFWQEQYLEQYVKLGGSKIKFLTGNAGSGKSHFLELFLAGASKNNYKTVSLSAKNVWIHDFKEIYAAVLSEIDILSCLEKCAAKIINELGYGSEEIPEGMPFTDYLSGINQLDPIVKREIRLQLNRMFLQNPLIDNNFAFCCSLLTGGILGHPLLEDHNRELLLMWLAGSREAKLAAVRALGLSPSRITKYNARHMLRSLVEVIKTAGYFGLLIAMDDMEILIQNNGLDEIRYTKMRREDAYESIRELIDEIDTLKNIMFIFSFNRCLIDNDNFGLKSYQALWMRIQNEIEGERFNRFTDMVDMDRLARQEYDEATVMEMSRRIAGVLAGLDGKISPLGEDMARDLIERARYGQISLPRMISLATAGLEVGYD
ncbi:MAG: ATP-binding protein [Clostridiales bacterium]|nr:ATP-binding protein [Clostridiales bacterium]